MQIEKSLAAILVVATVVVVVTVFSFLLSLHARLTGNMDWAILASVGDYWSGHLNSISLVVLVFSFYLQRREFILQREESVAHGAVMDAQRRELGNQCEALRDQIRVLEHDFLQRGLHFSYKVLWERASAIEFCHYYQEERSRVVKYGLVALAEAIKRQKQCNDDRYNILVDVNCLIDVVEMARCFRRAQEKIAHGSMVDHVFNSIVPVEVIQFVKVCEKERDEQVEMFERHALSHETTKLAKDLIRAGWFFSYNHDASNKHYVILRNHFLDLCFEAYSHNKEKAFWSVLYQKMNDFPGA